MIPLVEHRIATSPLGPVAAQMYEYVYAAGGVYLRARREGLEVCLPLAAAELRGLADVEPSIELAYPRVPRALVTAVLGGASIIGLPGAPKECLFYLWYDVEAARWELVFPPQIATGASVRPAEAGGGAAYARALVEVHSHHAMEPTFSATDDADEVGFRIFAVVGDLWGTPRLRVRVGVYGYFYEIPAETIFELPDDLRCAVLEDRYV